MSTLKNNCLLCLLRYCSHYEHHYLYYRHFSCLFSGFRNLKRDVPSLHSLSQIHDMNPHLLYLIIIIIKMWDAIR